MKLVKHLVFVVLLVSTLTVTAFAGDIETPGYVPPPPPRVMTSNDDSTPITDANTLTGAVTETSDYLLLEALVALLSVY
jgi:hypothetical protein